MYKKKSVFSVLIFLIGFSVFFFKKPEKKGFLEFPVQFVSEFPCWQIEMEGKSFLVEIDTGFSDQFGFKGDVIDSLLNKNPLGVQSSIDVAGNRYTEFTFQIPEIKLLDAKITNTTVIEENRFLVEKGSALFPDRKISAERQRYLDEVSGRIGMEVLLQMDYWLFDLGNSSVCVIKDLYKAREKGVFNLTGFLEVPFELDDCLVITEFDTDFGKKKFILDTGATLSVLMPQQDEESHHWVTTQKFGIKETDLGAMDLYLFRFSEKLGVDGILGMDFFRNHAIFLDVKNQKLFIGPPISKKQPFFSRFFTRSEAV